MSEPATSFIARVAVGSGDFELVIQLPPAEAKAWGYDERLPLLIISSYISNRDVLQHKTVHGEQVIVNWEAVQLVRFENPWLGIPAS